MMAAQRPSLFLSYRRTDTGGYAGRLTDALEQRFGHGSVFHDVETIAPGTDFAVSIDQAIAQATVVLVLIGDGWLEARDASGARLLDRDDDFVRIEAATALSSGRTVLPLLVEGARMPTPDTLPPDLRRLARQQALELSDSRWAHDIDRLVEAISRLGVAPVSAVAPLAPVAPAAPIAPVASSTRRPLLLALAGLAVAGAVTAALFLRAPGVPELAGRWDLPSGSYWIVVQEGKRLRIEETHYQSREVWKRGSGTIEEAGVRVALDWVFERLPTETGMLGLSADGRTLSGELRSPGTEPGRERRSPTVLVRR